MSNDNLIVNFRNFLTFSQFLLRVNINLENIINQVYQNTEVQSLNDGSVPILQRVTHHLYLTQFSVDAEEFIHE